VLSNDGVIAPMNNDSGSGGSGSGSGGGAAHGSNALNKKKKGFFSCFACLQGV
jgi:hypothetical protein